MERMKWPTSSTHFLLLNLETFLILQLGLENGKAGEHIAEGHSINPLIFSKKS